MKTTLFDGSNYIPERDDTRLKLAITRIIDLMSDCKWRKLQTISSITKVPEASVSAHLRHLRKERYGNQVVRKRYLSEGLWEYQLIITNPIVLCNMFGFEFTVSSIARFLFKVEEGNIITIQINPHIQEYGKVKLDSISNNDTTPSFSHLLFTVELMEETFTYSKGSLLDIEPTDLLSSMYLPQNQIIK